MEADRDGNDADRPVADGVVNDPRLLGPAEPGLVQRGSNRRFAAQRNGPSPVEMGGFDGRLAPIGGQRDIDEVGTEHGQQSRRHAVADVGEAIIRPGGPQRRERDQVTNAPAQVVYVSKRLDPWHDHALLGVQTAEVCRIELIGYLPVPDGKVFPLPDIAHPSGLRAGALRPFIAHLS